MLVYIVKIVSNKMWGKFKLEFLISYEVLKKSRNFCGNGLY